MTSDPPRPEETRGLYGQRPSKSHDSIRRKQFRRIEELTPIERMIAALELSEEMLEPRGRDTTEGQGSR